MCVYASQVAACIGRNPHKSAGEAIACMWQRMDPARFRAAMARNGLRSEEDEVRSLMHACGEVADLVEGSLRPARTSREVATVYHEAKDRLGRLPVDAAQRDLVDSVLRKNLFTSYGTLAEPETLRHIRTHMGIACHADPRFHKKRVGEVDGTPWFVGGKIDAMSDENDLLIEVKNRVNKLFFRAPAWETLQVQAYLELLDVEQGVLIECYRDAETVRANAIPIARNRAQWQREVVPRLARFVEFLLRLLGDERLQDEFLRHPDPSAMLDLGKKCLRTEYGNVSETPEIATSGPGSDGKRPQ